MDGTLLEGDSLWESLLALLGTHPWIVFLIPFWLLKGKARFKHEIARHASLNISTLPLRNDVVEFLREEKQKGRKLILATAADRSIASAVAQRLGLFDAVLASDGATNLGGENKKRAIQSLLDGKQFDYVANSKVDIPIWECSRTAILVGPTDSLLATARRTFSVGAVFARRNSSWSALWTAIRPQHWVKNLLVFVPLVLAHVISRPLLEEAALAFASFSLCASGVYVLNDLFDLESDRLHPTKSARAFASGAVPLSSGVALAALFPIAALLLASRLPRLFFIEICSYAILSVFYSTYAKRIPMLDVLLLTGLYLLRILAGGAATDVPVSPWLLAFSMFLLLSLAFTKRYTELARQTGKLEGPSSSSKRNYLPEDADLIRQFGVASGYISVLVLALYVNGREVTALYRQPEWIWLVCPVLLFWISRVWFLANRGQLQEDPVVFAVHDSVSYLLGFIILLVLVVAS